MPPSLDAPIPKMMGQMTSGNGHSPHTPLCIPSSHCQIRSHHPPGDTSWAHTWPPWDHLHQHVIHLQRSLFHEGKKTKTQVSTGDQAAEVLNYALTFLAFPYLCDRSFRHVQWPLGTCHPPLVVSLHLTTATHSASCYTKHKNKQIIQ